MAAAGVSDLPVLDPTADLVDLLGALVDIESVSGDEGLITDAIQAALEPLDHLELVRDGDVLVARTQLGRAERVVLAGHTDTVPIARNVPSWVTGEGDDRVVWGRGSCDMKAGVAVQLAVAAAVREPARDLSFIFYDHEEVEASLNGLARIARERPELLEATFAVLRRTLERPRRGRLPGDDARGGHVHRPGGPLGPVLDGAQRRPRRRSAPGPARRAHAGRGRGGGAGLPRGHERGPHQRRHRRQRHPGPLRRRGQLPLRPRQGRSAGRGLRPGRAGRLRGRDHRRRRRGPARARPGGRGGLPRGGRRRGAPQVRLDRRRPLLRARRSPPSTSGPATRARRTPTTSSARPPTSTPAATRCCAGWAESGRTPAPAPRVHV